MAVTSPENPVVDKENDVPSATENSLKAAAANSSSPDDVRFQMTSVNEEKNKGSRKGTIVQFIIVAILSMAVGAVGAIFIYREIVGNAEPSPQTVTPSVSGQNQELSDNGGLGDGGFAGGIELPPPPPPNDRREATTSTSNGDDPPQPPVFDGGNFGGLFLGQGEDPALEPPFPLGGRPEPVDVTFPVTNGNFGPPNSEDSMPTGVMEDIAHHSFQNRIGPSKVDYTQISCDFDTPCEWFRIEDWTVQNKTIGNVSDLGVYYSGNYLLFQNHLPGVNIIVTNDVIVSKFNAVFCLSFVYYLPGPSGVLYVQIVDSNTGDMRAVFSDRNYSEVWRKSNVTITTSSDFVILLEVENLLNDSMIAIDNVVLTNETCINTQESESNPPLTVQPFIPAAL